MAQFALPLGQVSQGSPSRIVVGNANAAALEACAHAGNWPFRTAILFGPARSGKSLIAQWFAQNGYGEAIDDADHMDETALFHRWNRAQEEARPLLLTASVGQDAGQDGGQDGAGWQIALPDLASRLGAAMRLDIGVPDDVMMADLLAIHAEMRGLAVAEDGFRYLATRCERSHEGAERLVAIIDRISLERKQPAGPAIWREALEEMTGQVQPRLL